MTQRERIANGLLFTDMTEGLPEDRLRGKEYVYDHNDTRPTEVQARMDLAEEGDRRNVCFPVTIEDGVGIGSGAIINPEILRL